MSYLDPENSYLLGDFWLEKIFQAFFATLLDEDIERETTNQQFDGPLWGVPSAWFLILKRLLGLPYFTHKKEVDFYQQEFTTQHNSKPFELDWGFVFRLVNYVFLGGFIIEPLKALWRVVFEFPLRALEVTIFHIRCYLNPKGVMNKLLYGLEQLFILPRVLSRAIFRPLKSYYLVGTAFEENPRLKRAAQITSAVVSITAAVAICVALPFLIHIMAPSVAPVIAHIAPQLGQAVTFLGSSLGAALTIAVTVIQATFNAVLPMTWMLFKKRPKQMLHFYAQESTGLLSSVVETPEATAPSVKSTARVVPAPAQAATSGSKSTAPKRTQAQKDRASVAALAHQGIARTQHSKVASDEDIQAAALTGSFAK